jgi:hypothetical protein
MELGVQLFLSVVPRWRSTPVLSRAALLATSNAPATSGGGVYIVGDGTLVIHDSTFDTTTAHNAGGAILIQVTELLLSSMTRPSTRTPLREMAELFMLGMRM